jgi:heat shock protein HslJ
MLNNIVFILEYLSLSDAVLVLKPCFMKNYTFALLFVFTCIIGCKKSNEGNEINRDSAFEGFTVNAKGTLDYVGYYKGVLPCADCEGIETSLNLNENATYTLRTTYLGKGNKIFEQKGTYSWNKNGSIVRLDNVEGAPNLYAVNKNAITQLNMRGRRIMGKLEKEYILTKQKEAPANAVIQDQSTAVVNLNNKMKAKTIITQVNPAIGKFTLAGTRWRLCRLHGKRIKGVGSKHFVLQLNSRDGKYNGFVGCNSFTGTYFMKSAFALSFTNGVSTMVVCDDMSVEKDFMKMLGEVDGYVLEGDELILKSKKNTVAQFKATISK